MARRPLNREEYEKRGALHKMTLIGEPAPTVATPTMWRCDVCGRELYKSLNSLIFHSPCICRTQVTLKPSDYEYLANRLEIVWGGFYPKTNKVKIMWVGRNGESFIASYSELAYDFIPNRLKGYIDG